MSSTAAARTGDRLPSAAMSRHARAPPPPLHTTRAAATTRSASTSTRWRTSGRRAWARWRSTTTARAASRPMTRSTGSGRRSCSPTSSRCTPCTCSRASGATTSRGARTSCATVTPTCRAHGHTRCSSRYDCIFRRGLVLTHDFFFSVLVEVGVRSSSRRGAARAPREWRDSSSSRVPRSTTTRDGSHERASRCLRRKWFAYIHTFTRNRRGRWCGLGEGVDDALRSDTALRDHFEGLFPGRVAAALVYLDLNEVRTKRRGLSGSGRVTTTSS